MHGLYSHSTNNDDNESDPGGDAIKVYHRARLQRMATRTKDDLNQVLQRVESTLIAYDEAVKSSLLQRGTTQAQMADIEQVADLKELEEILNDSIAKKRYKQKLMIFIVGHTEQITERIQLLNQLEQFFIEQKQNFKGPEFQDENVNPDEPDEVDHLLRSFDIKECYSNVKSLGIQLTELNDEIITHLIQTAATKQQTKNKKKVNQHSKEMKDLQSKLDTANADIVEKSSRIDELEQEIAKMTEVMEKSHNEKENSETNLKRYQDQIETLKQKNNSLQEAIDEYQNKVEDLQGTISQFEKPATIDNSTQCEVQENEERSQIKMESMDKPRKSSMVAVSTSPMAMAPTEITIDVDSEINLNEILHAPEDIDLNNVTSENMSTVYINLRRYAILRVHELMNDLETMESENANKMASFKNEFDDLKTTHEKDRRALTELAENAYKLQIKAQTTAEEAMNHLKIYMAEHEKQKAACSEQSTQTETVEENEGNAGLDGEQSHRNLSPKSQTLREEIEAKNGFRSDSLKQKYVGLLEQKQHELEDLKQMAALVFSRPPTEADDKSKYFENESSNFADTPIRLDQGQQTSFILSRKNSVDEQTVQSSIDSSRQLFYQLYEKVFKFRQAMSNILEQNKFEAFANGLLSIKQLMRDDHPEECLKNIELLLKEMIKVIQTTMNVYASKMREYEEREKNFLNSIKENEEPDESKLEKSIHFNENDHVVADLTVKYQNATDVLHKTMKDHEQEIKENQLFIAEQQKQNELLQQELARAQKNITRLEEEGFVEPSILFTRLDIERNDHFLKKALNQGKISDEKYEELHLVMKSYVTLPGRQFRNLVERYIQHRRALELTPDQIPVVSNDENSITVLEKMKNLHEKRSEEIQTRMDEIRQQRVDLAKSLTDNFDDLENQTSIFLVRPIFSYQGRAAVQKYMKLGSEHRSRMMQEQQNKKPHNPSRLSESEKSASTGQYDQRSNDQQETETNDGDSNDRLFHHVISTHPITPSHTKNIDLSTGHKHLVVQLGDISRLQELDLQRTMMPMAHTNTNLLSAFSRNPVEPLIPSLNLRSYVTFSRPGASRTSTRNKSTEILVPAARDIRSGFSNKSQSMHPRTPLNSGSGQTRTGSPSLPPIKRTIIPHNSLQSSIDEVSHPNFNTSVNS